MVSPLRVLIVDRDPLVGNLLEKLLEKDGYGVYRCASGEDAVEWARVHPVDAVILEVALTGIDGLETCRQLRRLTDAVILMAGPRGETDAAVQGLRLGADDYLDKPYTYDVLSSKLRACLNLRGRQNGAPAVSVGGTAGFLMDPGHRRVFVRDGRAISLTRKEFDLLQFLVENHDRVISADDILVRVWGPEYVGDRDLVKQFIYRLRSKLDSDPDQRKSIVTVRGSGYAFEPITRPSLKRLLAESSGTSASPRPVPRVLVPPAGEVSPSQPLGRFPSTGGARRSLPGSPKVRGMRGLPLAAGALMLFLGMVYGARIVVASGAALPGDRLYPIKIGLEGLRHALTLDEAEHPEIHLQYARERMAETSALLEAGRIEALSETLAAFESEMLAASWAVAHPGSAEAKESDALRAYLESEARLHDEVLSALLSVAPEEARPGLEHALIVLNTGRGTSRALFIGLEPAGVSAWMQRKATDQSSQAYPEWGPPPMGTPLLPQGVNPLWWQDDEGAGTTTGTGAEGEVSSTQAPVLGTGPGAPRSLEVTPTPTHPIPWPAPY